MMSDSDSDSNFFYESYESDESAYLDYDSEDPDYGRKTCLEKLESLSERFNLKREETTLYDLFYRLKRLIPEWTGPLPDLQNLFQGKEIDWILKTSVEILDSKDIELIKFVIRTGYKDTPEVDQDGKPSILRTTPIHFAAEEGNCDIIGDLFKIYDRFDVNYIDESGFTHFHAACCAGCDDVVEKFLELGQDPNCLALISRSIDPPLFLALDGGNERCVQLLLRSGADPSVINSRGMTSLDFIFEFHDDEWIEAFPKFNDEVHQLLRVNDRDHLGRIPLHEVLLHGHKHVAESLLKSGADPNMANADGSTPLHIICKRRDDDGLAKLFFEVNAEIGRVVQVDAVDKLGRTPLQWAVANLLPDTVDVILDHGADLCNFVYPTQNLFEECYEAKYKWNRSKLKIAISTPLIVENLENRGYKLDLSDVLTTMKLFAKYNSFPQSQFYSQSIVETKKNLFRNEHFMSIANKVVSPNLSFYDLVCLGSEEAAKKVSVKNMLCFVRSNQFGEEYYRSAIDLFLYEVIAGAFYRQWAPEFFMQLFRHRLPILCCDVIIKNLKKKDLWHVCLAAMSEN